MLKRFDGFGATAVEPGRARQAARPHPAWAGRRGGAALASPAARVGAVTDVTDWARVHMKR